MPIFTPEQIAEWRSQLAAEVSTPLQFRRWLESKDPNEIVGITSNGNNCPIASFLRDRLPWLDIFVGFNQLSTDMPGELVREHGHLNSEYSWCGCVDIYWYGYIESPNPGWLHKFVHGLDTADLPHKGPVTASQCLEVLVGVKPVLYRCTRNLPYQGKDCPGATNYLDRQGYYLVGCYNENDAIQAMKKLHPDKKDWDAGFTADPWDMDAAPKPWP